MSTGSTRRRSDGYTLNRRIRILTASLLLITGLVLATGTAAAQSGYSEKPFSGLGSKYEEGITDIQIVNEVDRDGDGYLSSFDVQFNGETSIRENGKEYEGKALQAKGDPKVAIELAEEFGDTQLVHLETFDFGLPIIQSRTTITTEKLQSNYFPATDTDYGPILRGGRIDVVDVALFDSDTSPDKYKPALTSRGLQHDEWSDNDRLKLAEPVRLEPPSQDRLDTVEVTSNVQGADVYVDGEKVGTTPWSGDFPVEDKSGATETTIRVKKEGYASASTVIQIQPPQKVNLVLQETKKPLVVKSDPTGATVKIDGETVGTTPFSKMLPTRESVDVTVEESGYETHTAKDVSTPATISAGLKNTSSSGGDLLLDPALIDGLALEALLPDISLTSTANASFTAPPSNLQSGATYTFDASPSYSLTANITDYRWDFGSGDTALRQTPEVRHAFDRPGRYQIELQIRDSSGNTLDRVTETVTVENTPPVPELDVSGERTAGKSLTFDASASTDHDGAVLQYLWDFDGDGATDRTTSSPTTTHAYADPGTYDPSITARDNQDAEATAKITGLTIETPNQKPEPSITAPPNDLQTGAAYTFDATDSDDPDGTVQSYNWDFGDGEQATGETPTHSFDEPGTHDVTLLVEDDDGATDTATETVEVTGEAVQTTPAPEPERTETRSTPETTGDSGTSDVSSEDMEAIVRIIKSLIELLQ